MSVYEVAVGEVVSLLFRDPCCMGSLPWVTAVLLSAAKCSATAIIPCPDHQDWDSRASTIPLIRSRLSRSYGLIRYLGAGKGLDSRGLKGDF